MLTVLIATHNGARTLPEVLEAYGGLRAPDRGWKLVIVDNASTDDTASVVRSFAGRLPLSYLFVDAPGQNLARNRGLSVADGDLVVFTDDDAVPHADLLIQMRSAVDTHPEFGIFSGGIVPRWEVRPEPWLVESVPLAPCFAITDSAWEEGPIKSDFVFSPNMAIRMEIFQAGYRFDETIGPRPGSYAMGSETELTRRLNAAGIRAWHVRGAIVEHMIRSYQMAPEWLLARAVRYGRGQYRWSAADPGHAPGALTTAVRLGRGILASSVRIAKARWRGDRRDLFRSRWDRNRLFGTLVEAFRVRSMKLLRPIRGR
jgi:glycosyltransferase involved in cell wall biosynthesis